MTDNEYMKMVYLSLLNRNVELNYDFFFRCHLLKSELQHINMHATMHVMG